MIENSYNISSLKNDLEFSIVFKSGLRFHRDFLTIHAIPLSSFKNHLKAKRQYTRHVDSNILLGFSINRKVAKACKRNLIKRRLKAIVRTLRLYNMAIIFVCRKGTAELDYQSLESHIKYSIKKILQKRQETPPTKGQQTRSAKAR